MRTAELRRVGLLRWVAIRNAGYFRQGYGGGGVDFLSQRRGYANSTAGAPAAQQSFQVLTPKLSSFAYYVRRDAETSLFQRLLAKDPQGIVCVIGPLNVGKKTLLQNAMGSRPAAVIDMNKHSSIYTTEEFTRILLKQFRALNEHQTWQKVSNHLGLVRLFGFELRMKKPESKGQQEEVDFLEFSALLDHVEEALLAVGKGITEMESATQEFRPVIVVQSGNKLRPLLNWRGDEGKRALKRFFRWCVYVTAHRRLCHVVLTSNDGLFIQWLQHEFGLGQFLQTVVIEDPAEDEARQFLRLIVHRLQQCDTPVPTFDVLPVLHTLGNRFHDLQGFMQSLMMTGDPEEAMQHCLAIQTRQILQGLRPHSFRPREMKLVNWTTGQWLRTMRLLDTHDGVLDYNYLRNQVFYEDPGALHSLCHHGLLAFRPYGCVSTSAKPWILSHPQYKYHLRSQPSVIDNLSATITVPSTAFLTGVRWVLARLPPTLLLLQVSLSTTPKAYRVIALKNLEYAHLEQVIRENWRLCGNFELLVTTEQHEQVFSDEGMLKLSHMQRLNVDVVCCGNVDACDVKPQAAAAAAATITPQNLEGLGAKPSSGESTSSTSNIPSGTAPVANTMVISEEGGSTAAASSSSAEL